jgi:hypothetical protein
MMNFFSVSSEQRAEPKPVPIGDPRLEPTPDYGTLGPDSDVSSSGPDSPMRPAGRLAPFRTAALGVLLAILFVGFFIRLGSAHSVWSRFADLFPRDSAPLAAPSAETIRQIDHLKPQKQAETLLELAVANSDGAADQISSRVDRWQGKLKWNSQIATLTRAALNSNDMRVRESGVEVELAAYGLSKNSTSFNYLLQSATSSDHAQKIWALWALGLMGNRGVQSAYVMQVLTAHLKDSDVDSRRWAVEGLALVGSSEAVPVLLTAMHDDASPSVREAAAGALAESGMFTHEQRMSAVPQLLTYTDDSSLDTQTHTWAFEALGDITQQRLPNDPAEWRSWYENRQ